jgi:hypothetical protein
MPGNGKLALKMTIEKQHAISPVSPGIGSQDDQLF